MEGVRQWPMLPSGAKGLSKVSMCNTAFETLADNVFRHNYSMMQNKKKY
jgi:hypothetical protein